MPFLRAHRQKRLASCILLAGCVLLGGCSQLSRIGGCKRFVQLANQTVAELRALDSTNRIRPSAEAYQRLATRFDQFEKELAAIDAGDRALAKSIEDIQKTMQATASDCRAYADELAEHDALANGDRSKNQTAARRKLEKTHTKMTRTLRAYQSQVARINALCQPSG